MGIFGKTNYPHLRGVNSQNNTIGIPKLMAIGLKYVVPVMNRLLQDIIYTIRTPADYDKYRYELAIY